METMIQNLQMVITSIDKILAEKCQKPEDRCSAKDLFSDLVKMTSISEDELKAFDGTIRHYVKKYSKYEIARGVGGGFRLKQDKPVTAKSSKSQKTNDEITNQVRAIVEERVAAKIAAQKTIDIKSTTEDTNEEFSEPDSIETSSEENEEDGF